MHYLSMTQVQLWWGTVVGIAQDSSGRYVYTETKTLQNVQESEMEVVRAQVTYFEFQFIHYHRIENAKLEESALKEMIYSISL